MGRVPRHRTALGASLVVAVVTIITVATVVARRDTGASVEAAAVDRTAAPAPASTPASTTSASTTTAVTPVPPGPTEHIVVDGFAAGARVFVTQCATADEATCSMPRGEFVTDPSGAVTADVAVDEWVFSSIGWTRCGPEPCVFVVGDGKILQHRFVAVTHTFDPPSPRPDPRLVITSDVGRSGTEISFTVTGLAAGQRTEVLVCARGEPGGVPTGDDPQANCVGSRNSIALRTDPSGTAAMAGFVLPALDCSEPARCWIGSWPVKGAPPIVATPITFAA